MTPGPGISRTPLPKGFLSAGINSGVRKYRPDLGIIYSEKESVCSGVFTTNQCKAAPVIYCQKILPSDCIRAVVTNSGQANAATGNEGVVANERMAKALADILNCKSHQIVTASTGVIGFPLQIEKIQSALPLLLERLDDVAEPFALAILTTDLVPKTVSTQVKLSQGEVSIAGICKGSGMIHPNMATMLGYLLTDVQISTPVATALLKDVVDMSFNMISVDGDTSTNDCVFLLANGASGISIVTDEDYRIFKNALIELSQLLAQAIVQDGEGATKLIEVNLTGLPTDELARKAARAITISPLVKAAMNGGDPNWGRILAKLGSAGVYPECLDRMTLKIQDVCVYENGRPVEFDIQEARQVLKKSRISISANFFQGNGNAKAWGCDLSKKYVEINGEYLT